MSHGEDMKQLSQQVQKFLSCTPKMASDTWVSPLAYIVGDVELDHRVSVFPFSVLRADFNSIFVGEATNIQDHCLVHVSEKCNVHIGKHVTIGHGAIVHGCEIGDNCLIGMHATILDGAKIGPNCLIGAHTLILENQIIPEGSLVVGVPGRVVKKISEQQRQLLQKSNDAYLVLMEQNQNLGGVL